MGLISSPFVCANCGRPDAWPWMSAALLRRRPGAGLRRFSKTKNLSRRLASAMSRMRNAGTCSATWMLTRMICRFEESALLTRGIRMASEMSFEDIRRAQEHAIRRWNERRRQRPVPEATRRAVLERCGGCCEDCDERCALEMHHLRYEVWNYKEPEIIFGRETPDDLAALCRYCHQQRHIDLNGDWWNDPEEMAAHWAGYWWEMGKD